MTESSMIPRMFRMVVPLGLLVVASLSSAEEGRPELDFVEVYASAWNTHDGAALAAMFTADADLIMGNRPRAVGREAIAEWWNTYFSRIAEGRRGEFEVLSEREIAPGVRLVNVGTKTFGEDEHGEELETRLARGTWVMVKREGTWLIAAMRGLPAEGDRRLAPGTDR